MHTGHYISGAGHGILILWLLFGGLFEPEPEPPQVADVAVLSEAEFAALTARSQPPESTSDVAAPPAPDAEAEPAPEPPAPEPAPTPQPEPEPTPAPEPEPAPQAPETPPQAEVSDVPPEPVAPEPEPESAPLPEVSERPQPRPAPRVAPEAVAPPEPDTAVADVEQPAVVPDPEVPTETPPEPEQEQTAPEAATTEIVTEAEEPAAAPTASLRPQTRPNRPTPAPTPEPEAETEPTQTAQPDPEPAPPTSTDTADAVADALAEALSGGTTDPQPDLPVGPPMTSGEKEGLRVAVQRCWVVDVGSQAANVTVTVAMEMDQSGRVAGDIRLIGSEGSPASAVDTAFQAARRAILRCQGDGYDLPAEKYAQWREIEMTFNPDGMRVR